MRCPILKLDPLVVSKIAAGEVIERPSSVVKELLENSIDAGARSITIEIAEGGRELIRVVDDGIGIPREELLLAVSNHATNKISESDDLFRVGTLGFRGEALASIAGVSQLRLQSRPADQSLGAAMEVQHGQCGPVLDCGCPQGTQFEIRNLFESVPVRRKFLKSKQTELGHITEAVIRTALSKPAVALCLVHNDRVIHERSAPMDCPASVRSFFGQEIAEALLPIDSQVDGVRIHGFVADPKVNKPNGKMQYLFVNGRFIRNRSLGHAVLEAYRGLLMIGRYPITFLFIELPADQVDVNAHPTKIEVRFQDPHRIYSQILSAIRNRFLASDLTARLQVPRTEASGWGPGLDTSQSSADLSRRATIREEFSLKGGSPSSDQPALWTDDRRPWPPASQDSSQEPSSPGPERLSIPSSEPDETSPTADLSKTSVPTHYEAPAEDFRLANSSPSPGRGDVIHALQLHNSYLVVEAEEGMLLIDQHALHERVLYEKLREKVARETLEVQELLVPEPVSLPAEHVGLILEQRQLLAKLGIRLEDFGQQCVLVQSFPVMLRKIEPAKLLQEIGQHLEETGKLPTLDELLEEILHMVACKAAVKAGDPLSPEEIDELIRQRHLACDSHHCPHGRPAILRFTLGDLERQFKRT